MGCYRRRSCTGARGFTLVELMAVVVLIGILAALAIVSYRSYLDSARAGEAKDFIQAIHAGQQRYQIATDGYLDCSNNLTSWYPGKPMGRKRNFTDDNHADHNCWALLNVHASEPTVFGFAVVAGSDGENPPTTGLAQQPSWPNPTVEPWYVIQAGGDHDNDQSLSFFVSSSFAPTEIFSQNDAE